MTQYQGKTVVITGAASGLGAAMADVFAAAGARLVLLDIDGERAQAKASALREAGVDVLAMAVDVANKAALAAVAESRRKPFWLL